MKREEVFVLEDENWRPLYENCWFVTSDSLLDVAPPEGKRIPNSLGFRFTPTKNEVCRGAGTLFAKTINKYVEESDSLLYEFMEQGFNFATYYSKKKGREFKRVNRSQGAFTKWTMRLDYDAELGKYIASVTLSKNPITNGIPLIRDAKIIEACLPKPIMENVFKLLTKQEI